MKIGDLAQISGVHLETIRYYQRLGIMPTPRQVYRRVRRYGDDALDRLHFIRRARALGFSLGEVKRLLELSTTGRCDEARAIAEQKSRTIEAQIANLRAVRSALYELIGACNAGAAGCPMVDRLSQEKSRKGRAGAVLAATVERASDHAETAAGGAMRSRRRAAATEPESSYAKSR